MEDSSKNAELERIFGANFDDSDLSELSSDEEAPRAASPEPVESEQEDNEEDRADDDFAPVSEGKLPTIKKTNKRTADGHDAEPRRKKRTKTVVEQIRTPSPEVELTPEEAHKRALDARLDAIIKKPKAKKKKKGVDEEDLGAAADDEEVFRLRTDMHNAAQADLQANAEGKPAVHKLKLLPLVTSTLQKTHLEMIALDHNILGAMRDWLEPLPDKSLPALNIQRALFALLMNIDATTLKESRIGRIVLFYSRCPRVDDAIKRTANQLITNWMRPLLRRSAAWRDKHIARAERPQDDTPRRSGPTRIRLSSLLPGMQDSATARRHARIPQSISATYTVAPRSRTQDYASSAAQAGNGKEAMERFKTFSRQLKSSKAAARRL